MSEPQVSRISLESRVFAGKLAVLVLVINAFAVILAGLALQHSHGLHVQRAAAASQNLAHILEKHFATTIEAIDDALLAVVDEVERQNAQGRRDGDAVRPSWTAVCGACRRPRGCGSQILSGTSSTMPASRPTGPASWVTAPISCNRATIPKPDW